MENNRRLWNQKRNPRKELVARAKENANTNGLIIHDIANRVIHFK